MQLHVKSTSSRRHLLGVLRLRRGLGLGLRQQAKLMVMRAPQGVKPEDFQVLADNAMKDACGLTNPRQPSRDQVIGMLRSAYEQ